MPRLSFLLLLLVTPAAAAASPVLSFTLPNGLRVAMEEDHRIPRVAVHVSYGVGWRDGPPGYRGLPHLFEHLMFEGSRHAPGQQFWSDLEAAGATDINGVTGPDETSCTETVPAHQLALALWLESDRLAFLLDQLTEARLEVVKSIVHDEFKRNVESAAAGFVPRMIADALYASGDPYREPLDEMQDIDVIRLRDVEWFGERFYRADNAILTLVGDFDPAEARHLVEIYFGPIVDHHGPVARRGGSLKQRDGQRLEIAALQHFPVTQIAWLTPPAFTGDDAILDVIGRLLVDGDRGRLVQALEQEQLLAAALDARQESRELSSQFTITATGELQTKPEDLLEIIDEELDRLRHSEVSPQELARAVAAVLAERAAETRTLAGRAAYIATSWRELFQPDARVFDQARYTRIKPEDVLRVSRTWLTPEKRVVAFIRPSRTADPGATLVSREGARP